MKSFFMVVLEIAKIIFCGEDYLRIYGTKKELEIYEKVKVGDLIGSKLEQDF